ncbi:MAG: hypothetical protein KHZ62_00560 [Clostridiales bacterium]|nr:hypothetical protein [Clostridiales bacterium]
MKSRLSQKKADDLAKHMAVKRQPICDIIPQLERKSNVVSEIVPTRICLGQY